MLRVRGEVLRRRLIHRSCEHEIKADRTAQSLGIGVGGDAVLKARGKEDQQTWLRGEIPDLLRTPTLRAEGTVVADSQTRHQFIELAWGMQTQATVIAAA